MPVRIPTHKAREMAAALRRGAWNAIVSADLLDPHGKKDFMGQLAQDWDALKATIKEKDDALAAMGQQLTDQAAQIPDAEDKRAAAEIHKAVSPAEATPLP